MQAEAEDLVSFTVELSKRLRFHRKKLKHISEIEKATTPEQQKLVDDEVNDISSLADDIKIPALPIETTVK